LVVAVCKDETREKEDNTADKSGALACHTKDEANPEGDKIARRF
jgi:hypothetical protein